MKLSNVIGLMGFIAVLGVALCMGLIPVQVFAIVALGWVFMLSVFIPENPQTKTFSNFRDSVKV